MYFVEKHRRLSVHEIFFELTKKISVISGRNRHPCGMSVSPSLRHLSGHTIIGVRRIHLSCMRQGIAK